MTRFVAPSAGGPTEVRVGRGATAALAAALRGRRAVLVADRAVARLHRGYLDAAWLGEVGLPQGEPAKRLEVVARGWNQFARMGLGRDDVVVALGGGAALDVAGFLASTWMRGVPWIAIPTTLVAQADACLGGKTAIDLPAGKNLVGSFHAPEAALADPSLLSTLPRREFAAARFELLKCGWIGDPVLVDSVRDDRLRGPRRLAEAVVRALRIKARLVAEDGRDHGRRRLLNLGHTFGHALELASAYRLRHGEAVGLGLLAACHAAYRLGRLDETRLRSRRQEVLDLGLPPLSPALVRRAVGAVRLDKKRDASSGLVLVLPTSQGVVVQEGVAAEVFEDALERTRADLATWPGPRRRARIKRG